MVTTSLPPLLNVSDSRIQAERLLQEDGHRHLGRHLLAWCEIAEGRVPSFLGDLARPVPGAPRIPAQVHAGWLLSLCHRSHEALNCLSEALDHDPENEELHLLIGACLQRVANYEASRNALERILRRTPQNRLARCFHARALLALGRWDQGFREMIDSHVPESPLEELFHEHEDRRWRGEDLTGKHIVLVAGPGVADQMLFTRFTRNLKNRRAHRISLVCSCPELVELMRSLPEINRVDFVKFEPFDHWVPLSSLPGLVNPSVREALWKKPYLRVSPGTAVARKARAGFRQKPLLGLAWKIDNPPGCRNMTLRHAPLGRSFDLGTLRWFLESVSPAFDVICLQDNPDAEERALLREHGVIFDPGERGDFTRLAEWVCAVDRLVAVDNTVAHLAGALRVPAHLALPYAPDWVWAGGGPSSPWYPHHLLYRQRAENDWTRSLPDLVRDLHRSLEPETSESGMRQAG